MISALTLFIKEKGYAIEKPIGKGGMGEVYLGQDTRLKRPVAIKICSLRSHPHSTEEAKNLAALNHPNIVQVYDVLEHLDHTIIIMEYVSGETLKSYLKNQHPDERCKLDILIGITQALCHAHSRGVFHCDLKSSNVVISYQNEVKLLDFGISVNLASSQQSSVNYCSHLTVSPEHQSDQPLDHQTDLFCLGLLAYDLFFNRHPYVSKQSTLTGDFFNQPKLDAHSLLPLLPDALATLLNQLVEVKKQQRPAQCEIVLEQLQMIAQDFDMADDSTQAMTQAMLPVQKKPKNRILLAAFTTVILTAIGLFFHFSAQDKKETVLLLPTLALNPVEANFALTIDDSLSQFLIQNSHYKLLPEADARLIAALSDKSQQEQLAIAGNELGATEIIMPTIRCDKIFCQVKLKSYRGPNWYVHSEKSGQLNVENFTSLYTFSQTLLEQITINNDVQNKLSSGDEQNYQQYLSIKQAFLNGEIKSDSDDKALTQLATLLSQNNKIYSAYSLYREIALNTYHIDGNPLLLTQLEALLAASPSHYKQSESYLIDLYSLYLAQQDWEKARAIIEQFKLKDLSQYYSLLGKWHYSQNQFSEAKLYYLQSLELKPTLTLRKSLAYLYYLDNDLEQALTETNKVVNVLPDDLFANQLLADIYVGQGDYKKSIQYYLSFIETSQTPIDYSNLSLALWLDQQPEKALYYAQKALELAPDNNGIKLNYADLLSVNHQIEQAHIYYLQIINKAITQPSARELLEKAQAHSQVGDHMSALKMLNSVVVNNEDKDFYFYTATVVNTNAKQFESALVNFEESLQQGYPIEWFHFPWYQPLCEFNTFNSKASDFCK